MLYSIVALLVFGSTKGTSDIVHGFIIGGAKS